MELKQYQRTVLNDLARYLELLDQTKSSGAAFRLFWQEKSAPSLGRYQDITPGVPNLCFKVPTGGGKTFLACNALSPIFEALPFTKTKAVVWLVPSDEILAQTVRTLKDTAHPYRQKIDVDFGGRVEVYTKQELLNGQNFNPTAVTEQLSVMVLSYDSFRASKKEGRKAFQENGALAAFARWMDDPAVLLADTDETALIQVIRWLNPVVIVDESHHARTELSLEMLNNFNPCFVLDLTATPRQQSNIISYVDAVQLKREHMVKLPVIVYNRDSTAEVIADTIDLRGKLEEMAALEQQRTGRYIRPIALLQAQPRSKEDSTTFERLRDKLVEAGIPAGQIAIRTAEVNELKGVDLTAPDCPIRYIVTVNALKEGWDCPFAYILASLANKTSQVDVEQILGRVLRLPYTVQHGQPALNMAYVLTASNDFDETVRRIIRGLNNAGFSDKDCRLAAPAAPAPQPPVQIEMKPAPTPEGTDEDDFANVDAPAIAQALEQRHAAAQEADPPKVDAMLEQAAQAGQAYDDALEQTSRDPLAGNSSWEVREHMTAWPVKPEFKADIENLMLPQFYQVVPESLFTEGTLELLDKEQLADGFTLRGKAYDIDFGAADDELAKVDVRESESGLPKVFKMSGADQKYFKEYFQSLPSESRVRQCKDIIFRQLNRMDTVDAGELHAYIDLIVSGMDKDQLAALEKAPAGCALKIQRKIEQLLTEHYKNTFHQWLETGRIVCQPAYRLPQAIHPVSSTEMFGGSLYQAEEDMNALEQSLVLELTGLGNIRWWHRNIARQGFCINGFINHYPDIMIMTNSGKLVLAETKGEHLKNDDSRDKLELGQAWKNAAGSMYRYYMVFADDAEPLPGAVRMKEFISILSNL